MQIQLNHNQKTYSANLAKPISIAIPLEENGGVNAFYAPPFTTDAVIAGDFVGDVTRGGPVNFKNVHINPHGNGTHTECLGHIHAKPYSIYNQLNQHHFLAELISVTPEKQGEDLVITKALMGEIHGLDTLIIRTLPNSTEKSSKNYSGTNPTYMSQNALQFLVDKGIQHLLLDVPSVDREKDDGVVAGHKAFWDFPSETRKNATITELIFVPNDVTDGLYLLNLQIAPFHLDATPSNPVLFQLTEL